MASGCPSVNLEQEDCDIACDDCKAKNIESRAVSYCNQCKEAFCPACEKGHGAFRRTKDHKLVTGAQLEKMSIGGSRRMPSIMICDQHQKMVSRFCIDHGAVFCPTCETIYHSACNKADIEEHSQTPQTRLELSKLQDKLIEFEKKYTGIEKERIKNKKDLATKMKDCMDEIDKVRKDVNAILDGLEKDMKAQVQEVERKISKEIEDHLTIAKDMLKQIMENKKILKECGETQQTVAMFVGINKAEKVIQEYDDTSKQIEKGIAELEIYFNPDDLFSDSMGQLKSLGKLQIRRWQRYIMTYPNISVGDVIRHHIGSRHVHSMVFLPDGKVVLACFDRGLKLLDEKFRPISALAISAMDVCLVSNTEVLVSHRDVIIQFVEVTPKMTIKETLNVGRFCKGIDFNNDLIYVTCHDCPGKGEVRVLDRAGIIQRRLGYDGTQYMFTVPDCVKVTKDGQRVIVTDRTDHSVTCLNQQGHVVYRYTDGDLKDPTGLMLVGEDYSMVCGFKSNNVHVISADGQKQRVLLNKDDGISYPNCISYRQTDDRLAVGTYNDSGYSLCTFTARI